MFDSTIFTPVQEWYVDRISVERNEKIYACCVEPYPDVTFTIHMTRRSLFYIINLIFPCLLIYGVSFLGFFLPVESGEKVNLEITILLALVVFLLIVGETLPPTPDAIPALGQLIFFSKAEWSSLPGRCCVKRIARVSLAHAHSNSEHSENLFRTQKVKHEARNVTAFCVCFARCNTES